MRIMYVRNSINHLILNRIMILRYQLRKRPGLIRIIIGIETLCLRAGVIFYGRSHDGLKGKVDDV